MIVRSTVFTVMLFLCAQPMAHAEREMRKSVRSIHAPIPTQGASLQGARLAILYGMLNNKGIKWLYEGETKNSVIARWDYRGGIVIANIVYDENQIQIQYLYGNAEYACQDLEAGVCHKNGMAYFNYMPHLRIAIERQIQWHRTHKGTENLEEGEDASQGGENQ
jgi:hypothetical protein